ncbi:MAG: hypothetical protein ACJA2M_002462 [Polaribacter sp.]|jgi:hypothetical protein
MNWFHARAMFAAGVLDSFDEIGFKCLIYILRYLWAIYQ